MIVNTPHSLILTKSTEAFGSDEQGTVINAMRPLKLSVLNLWHTLMLALHERLHTMLMTALTAKI